MEWHEIKQRFPKMSKNVRHIGVCDSQLGTRDYNIINYRTIPRDTIFTLITMFNFKLEIRVE